MRKECSELYQIVKIVEKEKEKGYSKFNTKLIVPYLNEYMELRTVKKDGVITHELEEVTYIQYVIDGIYFTYRISIDGKRNLLSKVNRPQWIGMDRAFDAEHANITESRVLVDCLVLDIKVSYFLKCLENDHEFMMHIMKNLLTKMSRISAKTNRLVFNTAKENLMFYILEYWNANGKENEICELAVENLYIAEEIGVCLRTLYRALNGLKKEGVIKVIKGNIRVTEEQIDMIREKLAYDSILNH